jgi:hypothetical protein
MRLIAGSTGLLITATLFGVACGGSTAVTQKWRDPSAAAPAMKLVIVQAENVTPATRHDVEDRFAAELSRRGIKAIPSYTALGETLPPPSGAVRASLTSRGYDAALVIRVGNADTTIREGASSSSYYGYGVKPTGREIVVETQVTSQAVLWDLRTGQAVWKARAKVINPSDGDEIAKRLVREIVPEMADQGLVPARQ